ncbi:type II toxin-antitoxin system HipA family toxin [Pseudomonas sp. 5P_3.1_Bac2]|uniref:type II toxin-antitoxin system HipA family toxin n=1 Tax=Pseudomonas sp. 5P_3.1_Bac2 TaxID=2971617 RepID=UPI0021C9E415|nr:type II toxin-antitoxin system HipA family toxin [Pseudomonas sp. 5P_3.1_Bac2]MCU1716832.1 type II toxin-antitoxin system HipA family toxin [Pseudomonas sp. 5P_3.1_Bac2]
MAKIAQVYLWDTLVGAVLWDENQSPATGTFEFDPAFTEIGLEIAPLTMPAIAGEVYAFAGLNPGAFKSLPPCLSDSLPDDFGNAVIDAWLAASGRDPQQFSPVERLLYIGSRGMGALEFRPALEKAANLTEQLQLEALVELAGRILQERTTQFAGLHLELQSEAEDEALKHLFQVGSSAGGQRPKAIIAINKATGEICSGQIEAPEGYSYWLFKFDVGNGASALGDPAGFGRVEYAYHLMAVAAGVQMSECRLYLDGPRAHFMTRRFDRLEDGDKLHVQTLCAMDQADYTLPGGYSYEQALQVCRDLGLPRQEQIELYRRMVFNVIARNQDDHTRNIAFQVWRDGVWHLTPAYDMCWAYRADSPWVSSHQMSLNGKRDNFSREDLLSVARQISRLDGSKIIHEVAAAVRRWREFAGQAGMTDTNLIGQIEQTHRLYLAD